MKSILERKLDFMQFQNLIILTFCCVMTMLAMFYSLSFEEYLNIKFSLLFLSSILVLIMFLKKGFYIENHSFFVATFLFGSVISKKQISISKFHYVAIPTGILSTNYNYTNDFRAYNKWEPDLNASVKSFNIYFWDEEYTYKEKILTLTNQKKIITAIEFISQNTELQFVKPDN